MPSITCPCCRAANAAGPNCRRCTADLSLLFTLEADRESLLAAAGRRLADGQPAEDLIAHAEALRPGPDVLRLRAVASLLDRDFAAALAAYRASVPASAGRSSSRPGAFSVSEIALPFVSFAM